MRKRVAVLIATALLLLSAGPAAAHVTGPCGPPEAESWSARDYAEHHISAMAKMGLLGAGGHKPGSHMGFSLCLGVH